MIERCLGMKIIGTQKELDWIREALANNCDGCVFGEKCSENACREQEQHGKENRRDQGRIKGSRG